MRMLRLFPALPALAALLFCGAILLADPAPAQNQTVYHGNVKSHIYHRPGCRHFDCKACTAVFTSKDEAHKAGYRACKVCRP